MIWQESRLLNLIMQQRATNILKQIVRGIVCGVRSFNAIETIFAKAASLNLSRSSNHQYFITVLLSNLSSSPSPFPFHPYYSNLPRLFLLHASDGTSKRSI